MTSPITLGHHSEQLPTSFPISRHLVRQAEQNCRRRCRVRANNVVPATGLSHGPTGLIALRTAHPSRSARSIRGCARDITRDLIRRSAVRVVETDVLIVGAGPTGLVTTSLLAGFGVRSMTIARHPSTAPEPRATFTYQRRVEVLRELGLEGRWGGLGTPLPSVGHSLFLTSLSGRELYRYRSYGTGEWASDYAAASPYVGFSAPQHIPPPPPPPSPRRRACKERTSQ